MSHRLHLFILLCFLVLFSGCGGVPKPAGFPDLVRSVTIKIHKAEQPLSGITVLLFPKDSELNFRVAGETDSNGTATIYTSRNTYTQKGAPAGQYTVQLVEALVVNDMRPFPDNLAEEQAWMKEYEAKLAALRSFPAILSSETDSPLEIEIVDSPFSVEYDVTQWEK